jgi:hypothetical protein
MKAFVWLMLVCLGASGNAHVPNDGDIHASIGPFTYLTPPWHTRINEPLCEGPGLVAEADLDHNGGVEVSMFYMNNPFAIVQYGKVLEERLKRMYISTGYRYWFNPQWSAALAFSSSYSIGNGKVMRDDFGPGMSHQGTSAADITEYGFDFSGQYEFFQHERWSTLVDLRYGLSITPKRNEDSSHVGVFIAVKYFIQSRQESLNGS